jgi:hypothetical protein
VRFAFAFSRELSSFGSAVTDGAGGGAGLDGGNAVHAPLAVTAPNTNAIAPTIQAFAIFRG